MGDQLNNVVSVVSESDRATDKAVTSQYLTIKQRTPIEQIM